MGWDPVEAVVRCVFAGYGCRGADSLVAFARAYAEAALGIAPAGGSCPFCGRAFASRRALLLHLRRSRCGAVARLVAAEAVAAYRAAEGLCKAFRAGGSTLYRCVACGARFPSRPACLEHAARRHARP